MKTWLIYTLIATFLFGIGATMQKHGMSTEFPKIQLKGLLRNLPKIIKTLFTNKLWLLGFLVGPIGGAFLFQAMSEGKISVIQPLMNVGMLVTVLTGVIILKERLRAMEWMAVFILIGGAVLLSIVPADITASEMRAVMLWSLVATVVGVGCLLSAILAFGNGLLTVEMVMATLAGFGFGLGVTLIKVLTFEAGNHFGHFNVLETGQWLWILKSPYFYAMLVMEIIGLSTFQGALSHGRVALVSPITTIASIVVPVIGGVIVFSESIGLVQGAGIITVIVGTAMLAGKDETQAEPAAEQAA